MTVTLRNATYHPSGNPEPSPADEHVTRRLREALGLIEVRVLDHVIVGERIFSFSQAGLLYAVFRVRRSIVTRPPDASVQRTALSRPSASAPAQSSYLRGASRADRRLPSPPASGPITDTSLRPPDAQHRNATPRACARPAPATINADRSKNTCQPHGRQNTDSRAPRSCGLPKVSIVMATRHGGQAPPAVSNPLRPPSGTGCSIR
jgi:RadC-like JAB domain